MSSARTEKIVGALRRHVTRAALAVGLAPMGIAAGQQTATPPAQPAPSSAPAFTPPKFQFLRQNENWLVLRDAPDSAREGFLNQIKYVPLNDDGSIWASFGGHMRGRVENWENFGFGAPANNDETFALWRLLVHGDLHFGKNARVFVEGISALSTDRDLPGGRRTLDVDELDIQQAFADFSFDINDSTRVTLRAGRQAFSFGAQRLVSPLPWANSLRSWDGVTAIINVSGWTVTGFWTQFAPVQKFSFNDPDSGTQFFGVYATGALGFVKGMNADVYVLGLHRDTAAFNGTAGREERYTIGGRIFGKTLGGALDYDLEGAFQIGEVGAGDVSAFMVAAQVGYTLADVATKPRLHLGFDYASGDDSPGGDVETFNQLFPLGHAFFGYIDTVGRQNIIDVSSGVTIKPTKKLTVRGDAHFFWRASDSDALFNAGGGVARASAPGASSFVGVELDLTVQYAISRHASGLLGYSRFFAGDFIDDTGANDDIGFLYAQLQYTF